MMQYALLCSFVITFSLIYTLIVYSVTKNPWVSTFVTVGGGLLFVLENMELHKAIIELEQELEFTKKSTHLIFTSRINNMQVEIERLRGCLANQVITKTRLMKIRSTKSL